MARAPAGCFGLVLGAFVGAALGVGAGLFVDEPVSHVLL